MKTEELLVGKKIYFTRHASRIGHLRAFIVDDGAIEEVTLRIGKLLKCRMIDEHIVVAGTGHNHVHTVASELGNIINQDKTTCPFEDMK